jgi:hypothetical protein
MLEIVNQVLSEATAGLRRTGPRLARRCVFFSLLRHPANDGPIVQSARPWKSQLGAGQPFGPGSALRHARIAVPSPMSPVQFPRRTVGFAPQTVQMGMRRIGTAIRRWAILFASDDRGQRNRPPKMTPSMVWPPELSVTAPGARSSEKKLHISSQAQSGLPEAPTCHRKKPGSQFSGIPRSPFWSPTSPMQFAGDPDSRASVPACRDASARTRARAGTRAREGGNTSA